MLRREIQLFGGFSVRLYSGEPCALPTKKARVLAAGGARGQARGHLDEAMRTFHACGAPARVAQAEELARSLGLADGDV